MVDNFDASYRYVTNVGRTFYFQTNKDAPKYKIASLDLDTSVTLFMTLLVSMLAKDV